MRADGRAITSPAGSRTGISPVQIDYGRLRQVFQSLIENAIQHSPYGAPVIIEAREISENDCDWLECIVKDCGAGLLSAAYAIKTQRRALFF